MTRRIVLLSWLVISIGCAGESYEIAPVSGRVTVDGQPLGDCQIRFQPLRSSEGNINPGPGAFAVTDQDGRFTLRTINPVRPGAVVGKHRVWMTTVKEEDATTELGLATAERVPPRYRNGQLDFEVQPEGTDQANFDLNTS